MTLVWQGPDLLHPQPSQRRLPPCPQVCPVAPGSDLRGKRRRPVLWTPAPGAPAPRRAGQAPSPSPFFQAGRRGAAEQMRPRGGELRSQLRSRCPRRGRAGAGRGRRPWAGLTGRDPLQHMSAPGRARAGQSAASPCLRGYFWAAPGGPARPCAAAGPMGCGGGGGA